MHLLINLFMNSLIFEGLCQESFLHLNVCKKKKSHVLGL